MSGLFTPKIKPRIVKPKIKKKKVPVITFNMQYRSPNHSQRKSEIDSIIIHHTAGLHPGCTRWLCMPEAKVSAHIVITTDGIPYKLVEEHRRAWHAGRGAFDADKDGVITQAEKYWNDRSLGIELEAVAPYAYTPAQLAMLDNVVYYYLYAHKSILTDWILGHKEISPGRKIDPENFDMAVFRARMKEWLIA
jgi:N-acetylmuramoyl-L-alanine amidase